MKDKLPIEWRIKIWLQMGERGISSNTICFVLCGLSGLELEDGFSGYSIGSIPYDPDDFRRCYELLDLIPEWKDRLSEVAKRYPQWKPLVGRWSDLEALYEAEAPSGKAPKLYALMRELTGQ
ncbi:MAG: hypothetical protein IJB53_00325 [Mailhella sp.]|nr:hypothetical protein [Mailhella sp.]